MDKECAREPVRGLKHPFAILPELRKIPYSRELVRIRKRVDLFLIAPRDVQVNEEADQKTHKNQETDKQCFLNDGVRFPHDLHIGDNGNDIPSVHLGHGDIAKNKFLMPVAEHGYAYFAVFQGIAERLHHIRVVLALADEIKQVGKGLVAGGMD